MTEGSIPGHLIAIAGPTAISIGLSTIYNMVDLYFIAHIGPAAIAGVAGATSLTLLFVALAQIPSVGATSLIARAVGRADYTQANTLFNQALYFSLAGSVVVAAIACFFGATFMAHLTKSPDVVASGARFIFAVAPASAMNFPISTMAATLRALGLARPAMRVQLFTVFLNLILAPTLIQGWGLPHPLGVSGAGLATSIAAAAGLLLMAFVFHQSQSLVKLRTLKVTPDFLTWRLIASIGLPTGTETILSVTATAIILGAISSFGTVAQAGFGVGARIGQAAVLPAMAIALAAPPIAAQNVGAGLYGRVRETFVTTLVLSISLMLAVTLAFEIWPRWFISPFTTDLGAIRVGVSFVKVVAWGFVFSAVSFTCSAIFQALGKTWPSLLGSGMRFGVIALFSSAAARTSHGLLAVWLTMVGATILQAAICMFMLRTQLNQQLERRVTSPAAFQS